MLPAVRDARGTAPDQERVDALASAACGLVTLEEAAARCGSDVDALLEGLDDEATERAVATRAAEWRATGKVAQGQAVTLLNKTVDRLNALIDGEQVLAASTLVKVAELAHKVSGLAAKQTEPVAEGSKFSVVIHLSDGRRLMGGDTRPAEVVDVHATDVSGGDDD